MRLESCFPISITSTTNSAQRKLSACPWMQVNQGRKPSLSHMYFLLDSIGYTIQCKPFIIGTRLFEVQKKKVMLLFTRITMEDVR